MHDARLQGIDHAQLEDADANAAQGRLIESQFVQSLTHVIIGFARSDDAKPGIWRGHHDLIQSIRGGIVSCGFQAVVIDAAFHLQAVGCEQGGVDLMGERPAVDLEARQRWLDTVRSHFDRARLVSHVRHHLEGRPQAAVAGERKAMQAQIEEFLHVAGIENRKIGVEERHLAVVGQGGTLTGRIIARHGQHTAVLADAGEIRMLEGIARAVDAGGFAVPDPQHAVVLGLGQEPDHLATEHRRGGQIFIDPGPKWI